MGAGGRPTKYDPIFIEKLDEYLLTTGREQTELPTVEGFAIYLDVSRDSIYEWAKENKEFSDTLKRLEDRQKSQLINDGLYGGKEVNPGMAIFLLKANHNMVETEKKLFGNADGSKLESLIVIKDGSQTQ